MKIVFCSAEVVPFAKTGGLADVCGALPLALEELGHEVVVIMPRFKSMGSAGYTIKSSNNQFSTTTIGKKVKVYFIENAEYFGREGIYGDENGDYPDNLDRFQYFCLKALQLLKEEKISADIIHCHDWQTALIPAYIKLLFDNDPFYRKLKSVLTIHNLAYQGVFLPDEFSKLGLPKKYFEPEGFEFYGKVNLLKGGIIFADVLTTVSPTYALEIQTAALGCGLEGVLRSRKDAVKGILNGVDYETWNPTSDKLIPKPFSAADLAGKKANKAALQKQVRLPGDPRVPVFGSVGRLSHQKGIDLFCQVADYLARLDLQIVILGVGDGRYHKMLRDVARKHKEKIALEVDFNEELAHLIYAGSDLFLMPSLYEPCGISQMISLAYGTVPLVFHTGGLADTISDYKNNGNGFVFVNHREEDFLGAVEEAVSLYQDPVKFEKLVKKAFGYHFSWKESAKSYVSIYEKLTK